MELASLYLHAKFHKLMKLSLKLCLSTYARCLQQHQTNHCRAGAVHIGLSGKLAGYNRQDHFNHVQMHMKIANVTQL